MWMRTRPTTTMTLEPKMVNGQPSMGKGGGGRSGDKADAEPHTALRGIPNSPLRSQELLLPPHRF